MFENINNVVLNICVILFTLFGGLFLFNVGMGLGQYLSEYQGTVEKLLEGLTKEELERALELKKRSIDEKTKSKFGLN